jgi:hypothetical protein
VLTTDLTNTGANWWIAQAQPIVLASLPALGYVARRTWRSEARSRIIVDLNILKELSDDSKVRDELAAAVDDQIRRVYGLPSLLGSRHPAFAWLALNEPWMVSRLHPAGGGGRRREPAQHFSARGALSHREDVPAPVGAAAVHGPLERVAAGRDRPYLPVTDESWSQSPDGQNLRELPTQPGTPLGATPWQAEAGHCDVMAHSGVG